MLYEVAVPQQPNRSQLEQKNYSRPLHVDCSVEYELPSQVIPPVTTGKTDPLLMIHPCYFRKIEAQRRSPFINNLPTTKTASSPIISRSASIVNQLNTPLSMQSQRTVVQQRQRHQQQQQQQPTHQTQLVSTQIQHQPISAIQYATSTIPQFSVASTNRQHSHHPQHHHQQQQQQPHHHHHHQNQQLWSDPLHHHPHHHHHPHYNKTVPVSVSKHRNDSLTTMSGSCIVSEVFATPESSVGDLWTDTNHSPLAAELFPESPVVVNPGKDLLTAGKYHQYLRAHRFHPYMSMTTSAFPQLTQMQQIPCYNV